MKRPTLKAFFAGIAGLTLTCLAACGGESTAPGGVVDDTGTSGTDTGASADTGPGVDTGAAVDTGTPADAPPGGCAKRTSGTNALHVTMQVSWGGSIGTEAGKGPVHVWTRSKFTVDASNNITATNVACGSVLPDIKTTPIAGGALVLAEFPGAMWDAPSMPTFPANGSQTGFDVGNEVSMKATTVLLGLKDPGAAWPPMPSIVGVDHDGDGKLGITSIPKNGGGYARPPTSLLRLNFADKLYIASRTISGTSGKRTSCDNHSGTATVTNFDNHVIGCHVAGGGECSAGDAKFIDDNRTVYKVESATYEAKIVPDTATCADVRAALPPK